MKKSFNILTILGSPHDSNSNTRAIAEDFVAELTAEGITADHRVISLGTSLVRPCRGCWNCTRNKPCPLGDDDLGEIKQAMIDCDMLVLGSPVYTNQVSAQMKALFDRLFTWCHVFPLLGKYSLSIVTTAGDGQQETGKFLEKMLATYGTFSYGTIAACGSYTPGFFPRRKEIQPKIRSVARRTASDIRQERRPRQTAWLRRMFTVMRRKITGVHVVNFIANGPDPGMPDPPAYMTWLLKKVIRKKNIPRGQTVKLSKLMQFELAWWRDRNWLNARSLKQILRAEPKPGFTIGKRLLGDARPETPTACQGG